MAPMPKSSIVSVEVVLRELLLQAQRRHSEGPNADTLAEYRKALKTFTCLVLYGKEPEEYFASGFRKP